MSYVPLDEVKSRGSIPLAPMIDFLFLMLAFFAFHAVTKVANRETKLELVKAKTTPSPFVRKNEEKVIHISVLDSGEYKWVTNVKEWPIKNPSDIASELKRQYQKGLLPEKKEATKILLKIDRNARWEPVLKALLAIREAGFDARPIYEPELAK